VVFLDGLEEARRRRRVFAIQRQVVSMKAPWVGVGDPGEVPIPLHGNAGRTFTLLKKIFLAAKDGHE
jgi:hypothetical protein